MPLDYSHPKTIIFLKENYDKVNEKRILWFVKNKSRILEAATLKDDHKNYTEKDVLKTSLELCIPALAAHHTVSSVYRKKIMADVQTQKKDNIVTESTMKPVEPHISSILHDDFIKGRRVYLKKRMEKAPDEKYNFCETTNNVYGWKMADYELIDTTTHRRRFYLKRDISNRSGCQSDPHYYQALLKDTFKCDN